MVTKIKTKTNTTVNSCTPVSCTCEELWSVSQQFCLKRLSEEVSANSYNFVDSYSVRARRIAGTYARFYLETEENGDPSKQGRFYWMALGAFASKTVACTLEHPTVRLGRFPNDLIVTASDWFGQGNFWLFQDIAGWHHYFSKFGSEVFFKCMNKRNTNNLVPQMKTAITNADWASDSLPKINYLKSNDYLVKGFNKVKEFESSSVKEIKIRLQYQNLLQIAYHEQGEILQPLIYENWRHKREIDAMDWFSLITPDVVLYFSNTCKVPQVTVQPKYRYRGSHAENKDDPKIVKFVSRPDADTVLYNYDSRMKWIKNAAEKFHDLMQKEKSYMHDQIQTMASWYNKADS